MKKGVDPRQLLFPLEYAKENIEKRNDSVVVESREIEKTTVLQFTSYVSCVERERKAQEKNMLLSAAQKLKW